MHPVLIPQQVGVDGWPVVSAIRVGTGIAPAEFAAVLDCGDGGDPRTRYGSVRICIWPADGRVIVRDGEYDLTMAEAQQDMLRLAKALPHYQVEAVVELREPYYQDRTSVFIDGAAEQVGCLVTTRVALVYAEHGDPLNEADAAGLSAAAEHHVRQLYARCAAPDDQG